MLGYTVVIVPGLFGGMASDYYKPLSRMFGTDDFVLMRAGEDWNPEEIACEIRQIEGPKKVICLSLGAMVGNILARDMDTEVYHICPYMGVEFINRQHKAYAYRLRHVFKALACVLTVVTRPFKGHRWYPLFGGTKPDGWYLSVYAIAKQLKYAFSEAPPINLADGAIASLGDRVVQARAAAQMSDNFVLAKRDDGSGPAHANLRNEGEEFGTKSKSATNSRLSDDAIAYLEAFVKMLDRRLR